MNFKTFNELQSYLFFSELFKQGLRDVFIAPGSRSTPLVLGSESQSELKKTVHFDERSLAFMALGNAKKTKVPNLIITTSGTATANLLPAIVEASYSETPLIVCTADRPFELLEVGANQAIKQKNMFQNYVIESFDVPAPNDKTHFESILTLAAQAFHSSLDKKGVVHINFHFQEPLAPLIQELDSYTLSPRILSYLNKNEKYITYSQNQTSDNTSHEFLSLENTGIILAGPFSEDLDSIFKLSQILNYPVISDIQCPLRFYDFKENIHMFELILENEGIPYPETVLHFGGTFTSKKVHKLLQQSKNVIQIVNTNRPQDPLHLSKKVIRGSAKNIYEFSKNNFKTFSKDYLNIWTSLNDLYKEKLQEELQPVLNECSLPFHIFKNKRNALFFIGSSMPIRDAEKFAPKSHRHEIHFNRGASGIDGNLSTALGISLNSSQDMICILGDLTLLHDLNALSLVEKQNHKTKIVVVNNDGGGIFSFLPVSSSPSVDHDVFNKYFSTPHGYNFKSLAEAFNLKYFNPMNPKELEEALSHPASSIIEISSNKEENLKFHRDLSSRFKL